MEFDRRYQQLNTAQRQAVDTIDGPVMVIAGPGTGKTELLSIRVANILKNTDTLPENILCLTFTESGAAAMRERLVSIIGKDAYKVAIHTFHSFGTEIISTHREYFYNNAIFSPADELAQYEILCGIFEDLDYKNPLATTMNGEYTYLEDAKKVISELKRSGGLTSDELVAVIENDETSLGAAAAILLPILNERVSPKIIAPLEAALSALQSICDSTPKLHQTKPLVTILTESLAHALEEASELGKPAPITAWKASWTTKNEQKELIFKATERLAKLKVLSGIYAEYLQRMETAGLYDYDDMILQVVHAMETHADLRASLQERYLYLMVDEFQDTNIAQMRILHNLTDNEVHEGSPNILIVGDDDQAVYGFQGAEVSHMLQFKEQFSTAQLIVLTDNYRSHETILQASREVITQGGDRLEARIPEVDKSLIAHRSGDGEVSIVSQLTAELERGWITEQILKTRQNDAKNSTQTRIAILARHHTDLLAIVPHLNQAGIPIRYEKQDNALEQPPILALELLAKTVVALAKGNHRGANALLPELLSHPAWQIPPVELWRLSLAAHEQQKQWLEIMENTPIFQPIHERLIRYAALSQTLALEPFLDLLIGKGDEQPSPLYVYYFGEAALQDNPTQYLDYLSGLQAIRTRLREHPSKGVTSSETFLDLIDVYRRLHLTITTPRASRGQDGDAVELLTAHKAKGLEFDDVYVLHTLDNKWGRSVRQRPRAISYPENLPLAPTGDTTDERLRLFYVAMTRAKKRLTMTFAEQSETARSAFLADFLVDTSITRHQADEPSQQTQTTALETAWYYPPSVSHDDLATVLAPRLEAYRLSATALTSFLDVPNGGPRAFLVNQLLRFPQAQSSAIAYGNAIHRALQQAHTHVIATGEQPSVQMVLQNFEEALKRERLDEADTALAIQKATDQLPIFLTSPNISFNADQKPEFSFAHQEVQLGDARLTGKLDLATIDTRSKTISITDYKTGKPAIGWNGASDFERMKLHRYRQQLIFYALLVGNSRDYHSYSIEKGSIVFVQPTKQSTASVLDMTFSADEIAYVTTLIEAVWRRVMSLSFPDTSSYPPTLAGIQAFERDLIDDKI